MVALGLKKNLLQIEKYRTTGLAKKLLNKKENMGKMWEKILATNMTEKSEYSKCLKSVYGHKRH